MCIMVQQILIGKQSVILSLARTNTTKMYFPNNMVNKIEIVVQYLCIMTSGLSLSDQQWCDNHVLKPICSVLTFVESIVLYVYRIKMRIDKLLEKARN